jgi:hypothetical protein
VEDIEIGGVLEEIDISGHVDDESAIAGEFDVDEIGFSFGGLVKSIGKVGKGIASAAKSVAKSPVLQVATGVVAVAFPAVGIPAAAALAAANQALKVAEKGAAAANDLNNKLKSLKGAAVAGDKRAATAVNAMQVVLAAKKAKKLGLQRLRPVAVPGRGSFSTTPVPLAKLKASQQPTSLYKPTASPSALAQKLAAGGSPLGKRVLAAVAAGKSVAVPSGVAVIPGQKPRRYAKLWIGKPPAGTKGARALPGAHAVTKGGFVVTGQTVYVA